MNGFNRARHVMISNGDVNELGVEFRNFEFI